MDRDVLYLWLVVILLAIVVGIAPILAAEKLQQIRDADHRLSQQIQDIQNQLEESQK